MKILLHPHLNSWKTAQYFYQQLIVVLCFSALRNNSKNQKLSILFMLSQRIHNSIQTSFIQFLLGPSYHLWDSKALLNNTYNFINFLMNFPSFKLSPQRIIYPIRHFLIFLQLFNYYWLFDLPLLLFQYCIHSNLSPNLF